MIKTVASPSGKKSQHYKTDQNDLQQSDKSKLLKEYVERNGEKK